MDNFVSKALVVAIVVGIIYFYFLKKRNGMVSQSMLTTAINDYFGLLLILFFIFVGIVSVIFIIKNQEYLGLIVPLCFFFIGYKSIKGILYRNFYIGSRNTILKKRHPKLISDKE